MAVVQLLDFEIDFTRNTGSAAWFFVIILKFIFTAIFGIKNHVKKFVGTKKISFSKPDFYKFFTRFVVVHPAGTKFNKIKI